jgi:hypothetical protein
MGKPMKPVVLGQNHIPHKVFAHYSSSCYNSQKNLRNQTTTYANNRYSSQNMKSQDFQEEVEEDNAGNDSFEGDIAKEGHINERGVGQSEFC